VLRFLPVVLFTGCAVIHGPTPEDTKFKDSERNWLEIYRNELIICIENKDIEGYHFFIQEIINEKRRLRKE
jgi:hypothetical protein